MGRLITACVVTLTCFILGIFMGFWIMVYEATGGVPALFTILFTIFLVGVFFPIPIVLLMNLRDWLRARSSQKNITMKK
jgi:ABC-type glycerol-3-phosphate transport system permease component